MKLHLIDGTYELFRQHFSKRPDHRGPGGEPLKATVGVASSLLSLLQSDTQSVTHVAVAFDNPIRSFRNDLFDGYKTEEGVEPELLAQFDAVEEAVAALGVTVWSMDQFEADDALATGAHRWAKETEQVQILSPDKDLTQCVVGDQVVTVNRRTEQIYDEAMVREAFGVSPESIPDLLGLMGDTADGIPGLPGIGGKTAAALLARYHHIESIPADEGTWDVKVRGTPAIAATLREMRPEALLYRRLATLRTDVPLKESLDDLAWRGVPKHRFEAWCDKLDVGTLRDRPRRWAS
jgi:5'-3' exonuclease